MLKLWDLWRYLTCNANVRPGRAHGPAKLANLNILKSKVKSLRTKEIEFGELLAKTYGFSKQRN